MDDDRLERPWLKEGRQEPQRLSEESQYLETPDASPVSLPAYGNSISREDVGKIRNLQNSTIRFIFNMRRVDHISPFRDAVKLLPVEAVCRIVTCCMVHKVLKFKEPHYLSMKLVYRGRSLNEAPAKMEGFNSRK
ncbi:hypothetical protein J6590_071018 [Homalodisca vitripennis]|nr:hypothetical protein J6590_071018 [Homalodisca vitripennis]